MKSLGTIALNNFFTCCFFHLSLCSTDEALHVCPLQELCDDKETYPEVSCSAEKIKKVGSCHSQSMKSMTTSIYSHCHQSTDFDCQKRTVYWRVTVKRDYDNMQDPVYFLNDTEALSGFTTSSLALRNLGIDRIKPGVFLNLSSSLRELDFSYNNIKTLHKYSLLKTMWLRILFLAYNELTEIPYEAIRWLWQLLKLYFKGNYIERITKSNFARLKGLRFLDLSENKINTIEDGSFYSLRFLRTLNLAENSLSNLQNRSFKGLYNLHEIDMGLNHLEAVPVIYYYVL